VGFGLGFVAAGEMALASDGDDCIDACGIATLGWALLGGGVFGTVGTSLGTRYGLSTTPPARCQAFTWRTSRSFSSRQITSQPRSRSCARMPMRAEVGKA
jgi:hypothetical protein